MLSALAVVLLALAGDPIQAEHRQAESPLQQARPDSQTAVRLARDSQRLFERQRRRLVDVDRTGRWGGDCDEVLGRMCLTLGEVGDWWLDEEGVELAEARDRLLEVLDEAASVAPGDGWVSGQRVTYLGEAGRWTDALRAARECGAEEPGWCEALVGFALHGAGRYVGAERAFDRALEQMPLDEARTWRDLEPLLDSDGRPLLERARAQGDDSLRAFEARVWRLADPLVLVPGNDRRSEHFARRVTMRVREDAANPFGMSWGDDLAELVLRYGAEVGWQRSFPQPGELLTQSSVVGHHHPYTRGHLPPGGALLRPTEVPPDAWNPAGRVEARSGYAAPYAPVILPAPAQIALVHVGDSVRVVARIELPHDTTYHARHDHPPLRLPEPYRGQPEVQGLYLVPLDDGPVRGVRREVAGDEGGLSVTAPAGDYLVSVERWSPSKGRAGRVRRGISARAVQPDVPVLSDLVLADADGDAGAREGTRDSLEGLLPHMLVGDSVTAGDTIQVGWQIDGLGWRRESITLELDLEGEPGGIFRRAGRLLGLVGDPPRVALDWTEAGPERPQPRQRVVELALPPDLPAGRYTLGLRAHIEGREPLVAVRTLHVSPRR